MGQAAADSKIILQSTNNFVRLENPKVLLPILKERLPKSCFVYNQVVKCDSFEDILIVYTLGSEINSDVWIVTIYLREDYGQNVSISAPNAVEGLEKIPLRTQEKFAAADFIEWDGTAVFCALEKRVSQMIFDISVNIKGNVTDMHPCFLYHMNLEEAQNIEIPSVPNIELRRLNPSSSDEIQFFVDTWKYSKKGTFSVFKKCLEVNASAGVFVGDKCVAGVLVTGTGLVSSLYTLAEYRGKGFGKAAMKNAFKEFAKEGCIPCSCVEVRNERSVNFHKSLGVEAISIVDWIDIKKLSID